MLFPFPVITTIDSRKEKKVDFLTSQEGSKPKPSRARYPKMCMSFTVSKKEKAALLALAPIWIPLALVGGLLYLVLRVPVKLASNAVGSTHQLSHTKDQKKEQTAQREASKGKLEVKADKTKERVQLMRLAKDQHDKRGLCHWFLGEFESAIAEFEQCDESVHMWLGLALCCVGRYEEGFEVISRMLESRGGFDEEGFQNLCYLTSDQHAWMQEYRGSVDLPSAPVFRSLLFFHIYNGALAVPERQVELIRAMLDLARRIAEIYLWNQNSDDKYFKLALVYYAQGAIGGVRTREAVLADPARLQCMRDCVASLGSNEGLVNDDVSREDVEMLLAMAQCFLSDGSGLENPPPRDLFYNTDVAPRYHRNNLLNGHNSVKHVNKSPHWCDHCGEFIKNIATGVRCSLCKANLHPQCVADAKGDECLSTAPCTLQQHRRNGNFSKRRMLMLVWKKSFPVAGKDIIRKIDAMVTQ